MPQPRSRYSTNPLPIAEVLRKYVLLPTTLRYGDKGGKDTKLDTNEVLTSTGMWPDLRAIQPNCSFTDQTMRAALKILLGWKKDDWKHLLKQEEHEDWVSTIAGRVRVQGRHIGQALIRKPKPPSWVSTLFTQKPLVLTRGAGHCSDAGDVDDGHDGLDGSEEQQEEELPRETDVLVESEPEFSDPDDVEEVVVIKKPAAATPQGIR